MDTYVLLVTGLSAAAVVLVAVAGKVMTRLSTGQLPRWRRLFGWPAAMLVLLAGLLLAATCLMALFPESPDKAGHWGILAISCVAFTVGFTWWTATRSRPPAVTHAPLAAAAVMPPVSLAQHRQEQPGRRQAWPRPGLEQGLLAIRAGRQARATSLTKACLAVAVPLGGASALAFGWLAPAIIAVGTAVFILQCHSIVGGVSEAEYRRLPGATDASGRHRCVFCGRWGIYRRGAYASNSTWHDCSSCRRHLFVD